MFTGSARSHLGLHAVLAIAALLLLSYAAPALAGEPATVTVRVIGANNQALVPLTQVTTTTTPVIKDGTHSCAGTSAAGALELATSGNWTGTWFTTSPPSYLVETIDGMSTPNFYWSFWRNNQESPVGVCAVELASGDSILFFAQCYEKCSGPPPNVLAIQTPATAEVNKPVQVTVLSYPNAGGPPTPAVGATVVGGGDASAPPTNEHGETTLTFAGDGRFTIHATGAAGEPPAVPAEVFVCAHEGNDGTCGTTAPPPNNNTNSTNTGPAIMNIGTGPSLHPAADLAKVTGIVNGHHYVRRHAPRTLTGSITVPTGNTLRSVLISLQRKHNGRCSNYDGRNGRFVRAVCGKASFTAIGAHSPFSYLLPSRLPAGRYVYEIEAQSATGQTTAPADGVSRIVFYVR